MSIDGDMLRFEDLKTKLISQLLKEEHHWRQHAKILWLQEGDSNTRFFHMHANGRRKKNRITRLQNSTGQLVSSNDDLEHVAVDYFEQLYSSNVGTVSDVIDLVAQKVTSSDNEMLLLPFTKDEF